MLQPSPTAPKRRGRLFRFGAAFVALLSVAGYLVVQYVTGGADAPGCQVASVAGGSAAYEFTPEQAVNAATIAAVGIGRGMPERAVAIALATSIQESGLRNIRHGDRDSLGLFQQRPSQGWGTPKEILDPAYAAGVFYEHLSKVSGYQRLPLTEAAQRVQRSGYPEAYAKHEGDAELLAAALTGRTAATLTCNGRIDPASTAGPDTVRSALVRDFGRDALQEAGAEAGGGRTASKTSPSPAVSAESDGRTVTVPVPAGKGAGASGSAAQRGWQLAHWAVANASALHIERVSYAGREWIAGNTDSRWRTTAGAERASGADGPVRIVTAQ